MPLILHFLILLVGSTKYQRDGTVIAGVLSAETPKHGIAVAVEIHRLVAFRVMATTARTYRLATAVVVGH